MGKRWTTRLLPFFSCIHAQVPAAPPVQPLFLQRVGTCKNGHRCSFAHGPQDRLPHIVTSATLCSIFQASCAVLAELGCACLGPGTVPACLCSSLGPGDTHTYLPARQ